MEPRLVDGRQRAQAHRNSWELPEVRQRARVRVARQADAPDSASGEVIQVASVSRPSRNARE